MIFDTLLIVVKVEFKLAGVMRVHQAMKSLKSPADEGFAITAKDARINMLVAFIPMLVMPFYFISFILACKELKKLFAKKRDIFLLGSSGAGKTSFLRCLQNPNSDDEPVPTHGFDVREVKIGGTTFSMPCADGASMRCTDVAGSDTFFKQVEAKIEEVVGRSWSWQRVVFVYCINLNKVAKDMGKCVVEMGGDLKDRVNKILAAKQREAHCMIIGTHGDECQNAIEHYKALQQCYGTRVQTPQLKIDWLGVADLRSKKGRFEAAKQFSEKLQAIDK